MSSQEGQDEVVTIVVKTHLTNQEIQVEVAAGETFDQIKGRIVEQYAGESPFTNFTFKTKDGEVDLYAEALGSVKVKDVLEIVPTKYTEAESAAHVSRTRTILGFEEDTPHAIDAGSSLYSKISGDVEESDKSKFVDEEVTEEMSQEELEKVAARNLSNRPEVLDHALKDGIDASMTVATAERPVRTKPALRSLQLSQWNPVAAHLRLKQGHLMYLQASTWEGKTFHITSTATGYYVSNCSGERFDPSPKKGNQRTYCLLTLIKNVSPMVEKVQSQNEDLYKQLDPAAYLKPTNSFLASPWMVKEPVDQLPDLARTQKIAASEDSKDWNEDLQCAREMKSDHDDVTGRIQRTQLLTKFSFDFQEAAVKAAKQIVHGDIQPMNPQEPQKSHIFLHKNMFFSYGADSIGDFARVGGDAAARYSTGKDVAGVNFVNQLDIDGLCSLCTAVVDYCGHRVVCQGPVPGIFRENQEHQIAYGSVDNRECIEHSDEFEPLMAKIAEACHLKAHMAYDNQGENGAKLVTAMDTKGLNGTDGRKYVLDLYRITPPDVTFVEKYCADKVAPYPHKMAVLRQEAVEEWFNNKYREYLLKDPKKEEDMSEEEVEKVKTERENYYKQLLEEVRLNPDVLVDKDTIPKSEHEQLEKDKQEVRQVCDYVTGTLVPGLVSDIEETRLSIPVDGSHLTQLMHRRGVNMRYLGELYKLAGDKKILSTLREVVLREAVSRAVKHIWNELVTQVALEQVSQFAAYFFNLLFGAQSDFDAFDIGLDSTKLREQIAAQVLARFRLDLPQDWLDKTELVPLFREVSKKLGLQWKSRQYELGGKPTTPPKKGYKNSVFIDEDLINVVPLVRASSFKSKLARDALEGGQMALKFRNDKETGLPLLFESLSLHEQIYGMISSATGQAYQAVAAVHHELGEYKMASQLSQKAVYILERTTGVDSFDTLYALLNLAMHEHQNNNMLGVFHILKHCMELWEVISGKQHPDSISTIINLSLALTWVKDYQSSLKWRQTALDIARQYFAEESVTVGQIQYQLSEAYTVTQHWDEAVEAATLAHKTFSKEFGDDHESTKEAKRWLEKLEPAAKQMKAQKQHQQQQQQQGIDAAALAAASNNSKLRRQHQSYQQRLAQGTVQEVQQPDNLATSRRLANANKSVDELMSYVTGAAPSTKPKKSKKAKKAKK